MLNKKPNLKSGKNKDKERKKKRGNQPKWERIDEQKLCNWIFWCSSCHETKAKKKPKEKKRDKNKKPKENKKKDKEEGRKKKRETEKKKVKKGEAKKGYGERKGDTEK